MNNSDPVSFEAIKPFLEEDIGSGDKTANIIAASSDAVAELITREPMMLCGQAWFNAVFFYLEPHINIEWHVNEGDLVVAGTLLCRLSGSARSIMTGERTAMNLLQTLSATASISNQYAKQVDGTDCKILDTRKTIPGLRVAQKYAVRCGGCFNHRMGLYDGILIKENHIIAAGSIAKAVMKGREQSDVPIEVEVENMDEFQEASVAEPDRILLDNFSMQNVTKAVQLNKGKIELEASGNVTLDNVLVIAETGVDFISVGALTKNIRAIDLSMRVALADI